jgi:uncharacterized protein involved in exopolysaccharide biosynthesis
MKALSTVALLIAFTLTVGGCGSSSSKPAYCGDLQKLKSQAQTLKSDLQKSPSMSTLTSGLQSLESQAKTTASALKSGLKTQFQPVQAALTTLKTQLQQLKGGGVSALHAALPTLKTNVEAVVTAWQTFRKSVKC